MSFTIPNYADAFNTAQAGPDKVDFDIFTSASGYTGVSTGGAVTFSSALIFNVAAGNGLISGDPVVWAAGSVTLNAADASNPRFDLVSVKNDSTLNKTTGTAAVAPVFPAIPASSMILAAIYVPANETTSQSNRIVDKRTSIPPGILDASGVVIGTEATDGVVTVGATSKAARIAPYNSAGADPFVTPLGSYSLQIPMTPFAATVISAGNYCFALQNGWAARMRFRSMEFLSAFNGVAEATTSKFHLCKFYGGGGTFTLGTNIFPAPKRGAYPPSSIWDSRYILSTAAGLTAPGGLQIGQPFAVFGAPRSANNLLASSGNRFVMKFQPGSPFDLDPGEGLAIRCNVAAVAGDSLVGFIEWDEIKI
jgi:hypothetical protein